MVIHHAGKSGDQRGASRREDFLDVSIKLESPDEYSRDGARFTLKFVKVRGKMPEPPELECHLITDDCGRLTFAIDKISKKTPGRLRVLTYIARNRPNYQKEIVQALGLSKQGVSKWVAKLRASGLLDSATLKATDKGLEQVDQHTSEEDEPEY